jgi:hypothetical protein
MTARQRAQQTVQVALTITVTISPIDDEQAEKTRQSFNNPALAADPSTQDQLERDRRMLDALLANDEALRGECLRHVIWELDRLRPSEQVIADLDAGDLTDAALVERLRAGLPDQDVDDLLELCQDDAFYENTGFYQDAISTEVGPVRLVGADATHSRAETAADR